MSPTPINTHDAEVAAALPARQAAEAAAAAAQAQDTTVTLPALTDYDMAQAQLVSKADVAEEVIVESE